MTRDGTVPSADARSRNTSCLNDSHSHLEPTLLHYSAYGAAALPLRRMMRKFVFGEPSKGTLGFVETFPLQEVDLRGR